MWGPPSVVEDERLGLLLGAGRVAVLRQLDRPRTTLELAARLGIAASSVSHHLSVFRRADLVHRRRMQRRVYYELNDTGRALTALFGIAGSNSAAEIEPQPIRR